MLLLLTGCAAPADVFDAFWTAIDEGYGPFEERLPEGRTWADIGEDWGGQVSEDLSGDELFDVLIGMAGELDDGHTSLRARLLGRDEDAWVSAYPHVDVLEEDLGDIIDEAYLSGETDSAGRGRLTWGRVDGVGYLRISEMEGFTLFSAEDADAGAAGEDIETALAALSDTAGLIVDVRGNGGGWDAVSVALASRFSDEAVLVWEKQSRSGPAHTDFTDWRPQHLDAARAYDGPVVVLTSGATFSAAETFTLAMSVLPDVTLLGEPTSGHLSDMSDGSLPNGWDYTLSGERYRSADGLFYEAVGVPVDVDVALDVDALLGEEQDAMLEAALALLGG